MTRDEAGTGIDLDWNRLRSGDNRALDPAHQDVFDEIERLPKLMDDAVAVVELQRSERLRLQARITELEALLIQIRDGTHKSAVVLRGMAEYALGRKGVV